MARIYIARTGSESDLLHGPDVVNNTVLAQGGIVVISSTSGMQTVGIGQTALADGLRYVNISDMGIDFNNQTPVTAGQGFTNTAIWQEIFDEIESGATFPGTSLTNGRIFWLTNTQGDNPPGIYRYNSTASAWEGAIVGASIVTLDNTAHTLTIGGTVYRIGDLDGRTSEEITAQIEASTGNVGTGLHIISDVAVENLSGDVTWSSQNWNGSSTTGNVSHLAVQYTTVDSSLAVGTFVQARSATGMLTHTFQIIGIGPGGGSLSGNNYYFFNAGPHSLQNVRIAGSTHGNNPAVLAALNAQNDWTFTHIVDSDFHLVGAGDGINIDVENDEAQFSVDDTVVREDEIPSMGNVPTNWNDLTRTGSALIPGNGIFFNDRDLALATEYRGSVGSTSEDIQVAAVAGTLEVPIGGVIEFSLGAGGLTNPLYAEGSARWDADNDEAIYYAMQLRGDDHLDEIYFAKAITVAGGSSPYGAVGEIELRFIGAVNIRTGAEQTTYPAGITFHDRVSILNNTVEAMRPPIPEGISRVQQGAQIYTEFGPDLNGDNPGTGLLFVARMGALELQTVNVTGTGTTIAYPTALNIADGDWIVVDYPTQGLAFYRVQIATGNVITNHLYQTIGVNGGTFTPESGSHTDTRYARLDNPSVPAGWFGVISGRANDGTTYNNNGSDIPVTRVTTGGDFWTITTAYDGTAGTGLTTTIAVR